jgi:hypothetical protein
LAMSKASLVGCLVGISLIALPVAVFGVGLATAAPRSAPAKQIASLEK